MFPVGGPGAPPVLFLPGGGAGWEDTSVPGRVVEGSGRSDLPVVIVGGGAAGLTAAIFAAAAGARALLLERTRDGGRKILISGGGRCNVLPSSLSPKRT
jgi:NADPH-dependent 2,4-dienoyl-CoA reductase/sulfur reductase-like enzyme